MKKITLRLPAKKVDMSEIVAPRPTKNAIKVLKVALERSYSEQQVIRKKATSLRGN